MNKISHFLFGMALLATINSAAAGEVGFKSGATKDDACWLVNEWANKRSWDKNTNYKECHDCIQESGGTWKCRAVSHNQSSSGRTPISPLAFEKTKVGYTETATPPPSGRNTNNIQFIQSYNNNPNLARMVIVNSSNTPATTHYSIWVRDSGYSFPARQIAEIKIVVPPNSEIIRDFHQFRAEGWRYEILN